MTELLVQNLNREQAEEFVSRRVIASEDTKKVISQFWKQEQNNLIGAVRHPVQSCVN